MTRIDKNTLLFFDASCLIAAAGRPSGGSGFLLSLCEREYIKGVVSQIVLLEAQRNIRTKIGEEALNRYYKLLMSVPFILAPVPPKSEQKYLERLVTEKDLHVVVAAVEIKVPYLLTLDKRLALQVNQAGLMVRALNPGEFIEEVLPTHKDFPKEDG